MLLADEEAERERARRRAALLHGSGAKDGRFVHGDRAGVRRALLRGGGAVGRIVNIARRGELHAHGLPRFVDPRFAVRRRSFGDIPVSVGLVRLVRRLPAEIEKAVFGVRAAHAVPVGDIVQPDEVRRRALALLREIERFTRSVEREIRPQAVAGRRVLLAGAVDEDRLSFRERPVGKRPFFQLPPVVRKAVVGELHALFRYVLYLYPVVILALESERVVIDRRLIDHERAFRFAALAERRVPRGGVRVSRRRPDTFGELAAVFAPQHMVGGQLGIARGAVGDRPARRDEIQRLPLAERERRVAFARRGLILARGENDAHPTARYRRVRGKIPDGLSVRNAPPLEAHDAVRRILQLEPVGKIAVGVLECRVVFIHHFGDAHRRRIVRRGGGAGQRERKREQRRGEHLCGSFHKNSSVLRQSVPS